MSESPPPAPASFWRPKWLLAGFLAGAILLVLAGRRAQRTDFHGPDFYRFHPLISPEARYQPTLEELCAVARARCRPDQVLVLIGGNSVLNGVAQSTPKLWSRRLQDLLGDGYAVVNLALRGGSPADAACVVSEALRDEFPRQILIANASYLDPVDPIGIEAYRYLIESAYDQGRLLPHRPRDERFAREWPRRHFTTTYLFNRLDGWVGFRTYWNKVAWERVSTVPFSLVPTFPDWMRARGNWPDPEPDGDAIPLHQRYLPEHFEIEMKVARAASATKLELDGQGGWRVQPPVLATFSSYADAFRPPVLRPKTLMLIGVSSPYYTRYYTPEEAQREKAAQRLTVKAWQDAGYAALAFGDDFTAENFHDRTHLNGTGGEKLARHVAEKVRSLSKELNYE